MSKVLIGPHNHCWEEVYLPYVTGSYGFYKGKSCLFSSFEKLNWHMDEPVDIVSRLSEYTHENSTVGEKQ